MSRNGQVVGVMEPSKRVYNARQMPTSEAAIKSIGFSQLYLAIGDEMNAGGIAVRFYWKPLVLLVWLGSVVMALGGFLSLSDRRLRVGAPKPARAAAAAE